MLHFIKRGYTLMITFYVCGIYIDVIKPVHKKN